MKNIFITLIIVFGLGSIFAQNTVKISGSIGSNINNLNDSFFIVTLQCLDSSNYVQKTYLNSNGQYSFEAIRGKSYTISLNDIFGGTKDPINGVSTLDLILIQRHILAISVLDAKRKIASDINNDGKVTASDLVELKKLILGISQEFSGGRTWIYIPSQFSDPTFPFLSIIDLKNLTTDTINQNFVAIKIGDVNGNTKWP